jgi:hypothetical protein
MAKQSTASNNPHRHSQSILPENEPNEAALPMLMNNTLAPTVNKLMKPEAIQDRVTGLMICGLPFKRVFTVMLVMRHPTALSRPPSFALSSSVSPFSDFDIS